MPTLAYAIVWYKAHAWYWIYHQSDMVTAHYLIFYAADFYFSTISKMYTMMFFNEVSVFEYHITAVKK